MKEQMSLPFQAHSSTSKRAADSMDESAATLRQKVFKYIELNGPCCDEQVQLGLCMNPSTQRPRRIELWRAGRIKIFGETNTSSNRKAKTWVVTTSGEE